MWYHTIDIAPGLATPGWFDLRAIVNDIPWPDLRNKRCLDVATYDGFFAFEMERRGAAEVVAVDIDDHRNIDWPPDYQAQAAAGIEEVGWPPSGTGFRVAAELKESKAQWHPVNIYDLNPAEIGHFDVVVCGSLLLHLRDPLRALEAVRSVTSGVFVSSEQVEATLNLLSRRKPLYKLNGSGAECQWFTFNSAGHERLLYAAGFEILSRSKPYTVRFNRHPMPKLDVREATRRMTLRGMTGSSTPGVLHQALVARPRV